MDERQIRAILAVMNFTADFECEWAASVMEVGDLGFEKGIIDEIRFYQIQEGHELWHSEELIWA